jgi:hypothetical protein
VVHRIAGGRIAFVARRIAWLTSRKRSQTDGRQQARFDSFNNSSRLVIVEERDWQSTNSQNLIWSERVVARVADMIDVHDVSQAAIIVAPEPFEKRATSSLEGLAPFRVQL